MPHTRPIRLAVRGCATSPNAPYGPLGRLGFLPGKAGTHRTDGCSSGLNRPWRLHLFDEPAGPALRIVFLSGTVPSRDPAPPHLPKRPQGLLRDSLVRLLGSTLPESGRPQ